MAVSEPITQALVLAAGRGERLGEWGRSHPKGLLLLNNKPLIAYHLCALAELGYRQVVINVRHCADQIIDCIGDGGAFGLSVTYSDERSCDAPDLWSGIQMAQAFLSAEKPWLMRSADVWATEPMPCEWPMRARLACAGAWLLCVPAASPGVSDFYLTDSGVIQSDASKNTAGQWVCFSGIACFAPGLVARYAALPSLMAFLRQLMRDELLYGQLTQSAYRNINTMTDLTAVRRWLSS